MPDFLLPTRLREAVDAAVRKHPSATGTDTRRFHHDRSPAFVAAIARAFQREYPTTGGTRVFWRPSPDAEQPLKLGRNELLYDIAVCRVETVRLEEKKMDLPHVAGVLWLVESEFAHNRRQLLRDSSKLVVGRADNKLFIASHSGNDDKLLDHLAKPAACCDGSVYLALVRHPKDWGSGPADIEVCQYAPGVKPWHRLA